MHGEEDNSWEPEGSLQSLTLETNWKKVRPPKAEAKTVPIDPPPAHKHNKIEITTDKLVETLQELTSQLQEIVDQPGKL